MTNGIYATGGRKWFDSGTNRVTLTNDIILQSVNGPKFTWIVGHRVNGTGQVLTNAVRCVGLGGSAVLSGFTLTNGSGGWGNYPGGGGVAAIRTITTASLVTNCIITDNVATNSSGGGAYRINLVNCVLTRNSASSGGGAAACTLINCLVVSNTAVVSGGGIYGSSTLGYSPTIGCTIVGNSGGGINNGGNGAMNNCIVYYNTGGNYTGIKMNYCCTTPTLNGDFTSFTNAPLFQNVAAGDFHLQSTSPCINAGNNSYAPNSTDLDGNPRIMGGTVDVGAYEYQTPTSTLSYAWAQQYGIPIDGSEDDLDSDADGMNNWQEWRTGTNPTNSASLLHMYSPSTGPVTSGITLTWQGVNGINYFVQRSDDQSSSGSFLTLRSNLFGNNGTMSYTDTSATNSGPYSYRVGVP